MKSLRLTEKTIACIDTFIFKRVSFAANHPMGINPPDVFFSAIVKVQLEVDKAISGIDHYYCGTVGFT